MEGIVPLILEYRYWILLPLTIVEGPIVALIASTLASAGYFNIYALAVFFLVRDLAMDGMYYALGHYGSKTRVVHNLLARIGVHEGHLEDVRTLWEKHPFKTMFIGKITYGIAASFIVLAGAVGMRLRVFYIYALVVALIQYGAMLTLGYFYGAAFGGDMVAIFANIQYALAFLAVIGIAYYFLARRAKKSLLQ
jgi:membrane protein DedA with SNARE-associated domain